MKTAVAYYRTSSATNVGTDKDSLPRQQEAVHKYAASAGLAIVHEYYDAAVSGTDMVEGRPGFSEMMEYMLGNGARTVLVETASRFARDHIVQGLGHLLLKRHGIELIPVDAPQHFTDESPTANMLRTIISAVSQFEKEALVAKLRAARERKRKLTGRCEGAKWMKPVPTETIAAAAMLRASGLSLRAVAEKLAGLGMLAPSGRPYHAGSIKAMLERHPKESS